jgi:hypothetical protein
LVSNFNAADSMQFQVGHLADRKTAAAATEDVARLTDSHAALGLIAGTELSGTHPATLATVVAVEAEIDADAGAKLKADPANAHPFSAFFASGTGVPA